MENTETKTVLTTESSAAESEPILFTEEILAQGLLNPIQTKGLQAEIKTAKRIWEPFTPGAGYNQFLW